MIINYWAVLLCGVLSIVLGALWFGPLFGKKWMEITGTNPADAEARKQMQKGAGKLYVVQFLLTLFQVYVLAFTLTGARLAVGIELSLLFWAGFVLPTVAGASMWNNDSSKVAWTKFLITAGYQLLAFLMFALILGYWKLG